MCEISAPQTLEVLNRFQMFAAGLLHNVPGWSIEARTAKLSQNLFHLYLLLNLVDRARSHWEKCEVSIHGQAAGANLSHGRGLLKAVS